MQPINNKHIQKYLRPHVLVACELCAVGAMDIFFQLLNIWILCQLVEGLFVAEKNTRVFVLIASSLICLALALTAKAFSVRLKLSLTRRLAVELRSALFAKVLRLSPLYPEEGDTSSLKSLAKGATSKFASYYTEFLPALVTFIVLSVAFLAHMAHAAVLVAICFIACVVASIFIYLFAQTKAQEKQLVHYMSANTLWARYKETLLGLNTLILYGADERRARELEQEAVAARAANVAEQKVALMPNAVLILCMLLSLCVSYATALITIRDTTALVPVVFELSLSALLFVMPTLRLSFAARSLGAYRNYVQEFESFMGLFEDESAGSETPHPGDHFFLKNVSVKNTAGTVALTNITLDIASVGITACIGLKGSGKSLLSKLLSGKISNYSGKVLLGGRDLREFSRESLNAYITCVGPSSGHISASIREDLHLANPYATDPELWQVLQSVGLKNIVLKKGGLDLLVQDAGFSMGELARLSLARAILHKSDVYILDCLLDDIDSDSEQIIMSAIKNIARYKAVILLSEKTLDGTHISYVFKEGKIVASGTHEQLLHQSEDYFHMWEEEQALDSLRFGFELMEENDAN